MSIEMKLTDRMSPFLTDKKRFKVALGGRGGTKSMTCIDICIMKVQTEGKRVCCFREYGSSIDDSVWSLIRDEIIRMNVPGFTITGRKISHISGGYFKSKGLGRDSKSVKSFAGFDIFLIEEGDFLTDEILKDLTPTLRKEGSELWVIFNPQSRNDAVSNRFLVPFYKDLLKNKVYEDELHYVVWTNYDENPWFPPELEKERQFDKEHLTKAEYNHKWLGHFNDTVPGSIIKMEWFDACIDAHLKLKFKPKGKHFVAHDPSDSGYDDKGLIHRHGSVYIQALLNKDNDVNDGMDWALEYSVKHGADLFIWDADGMGLGLKRQVKDYLHGESIDFHPFRGNDAVEDPNHAFEEDGIQVTDRKRQRTNKQSIKNLRAQKYWQYRTRIYNTFLALTKTEYRNQPVENLISFSSDIEELDILKSESCRVPRKKNTNGLIQICSKDDMKKMGIDSPNLADPAMMSLVTPEIIGNETGLNFSTPWS